MKLIQRKGGRKTDLASELLEQLECKTAFTIPIFGGIEIAESVVVTWVIMAALTLLSIFLVRDLRVENVSKKQLVLETVVGDNMTILSASVSRLVFIHKVHINGIVGNLLIKLVETFR